MESNKQLDESIDETFKKVFEINPNLSIEEADQKWIQYVKYLDETFERKIERFDSFMLALSSVERFYKEFPPEMINFSLQVLKNSNSNITSNDIVTKIQEQSIKIFYDTKTLYRQCTIKLHELNRKKFNYGFWNRPKTRKDLNSEYLFDSNTITKYLESIILSIKTYEETIQLYKNKIHQINLSQTNKLSVLINVYQELDRKSVV